MKQQQQETLMRSTNCGFDWTDDAIRELRRLWSEGYSTAEIGRRMGISKNAVVGKAHRLDLPARPSPIRTGKSPRPPRAPRRPPVPKLADTMPALLPAASGTTLFTWNAAKYSSRPRSDCCTDHHATMA